VFLRSILLEFGICFLEFTQVRGYPQLECVIRIAKNTESSCKYQV